MKVALIGLGKMGLAMARRLLAQGHQVVGYDLDPQAAEQAAAVGVATADTLEGAVALLEETPRLIWLMLPAGEAVGATLQRLVMLLGEGDIVVEGGNSHYRESQERAKMLRFKGIYMLDVGVSGGIWGEQNGFNLMVGGAEEAFQAVEPLFAALAPPGGYALVGPSGAGHFVKMVHNGIEYGILEALAEGFELLAAKQEFGLDLAALCDLWEHGSVIRSWLLELTGRILTADPTLDWVAPYVEDTGEGRWMVQEGIDLSVPLPAITLALQMRFRSRQESSFAARMVAALRAEFGGHAVRQQ